MDRCTRSILLAIAALGSIGCSGDGASCPTDCAQARDYDVLSYELVGAFDFETRILRGRETITLQLPQASSGIVSLDTYVDVHSVEAQGLALPFTHDMALGKLRVDLSALQRGAGPARFVVAYEARTSHALVVAGPRDDDPVPSRVVYTESEPQDGAYWRISNEDPSDRATWALELTVAADHDVVSNGERVRDAMDATGRTVRYELSQPIPSYLMAFAAGALVHADRAGTVPLSVWHRRGLFIDTAATLDVVERTMSTFAQLVGPYPWSRYSVVYLPGYPGGMENATITFNSETSGQGLVATELNAHELAHQWFGDWVTVHSFDDLWFKEGMATLLAAEAQRATRDVAGSGRLFGTDFGFFTSERARDRALAPDDKYTSGPYERAAWLLTQIRARIGESAFWGTLRRVLAEHALGSIDSEAFVRSFSPTLDAASIAQVLRALDSGDPISLEAAANTGSAGTTVRLVFRDPAQQLLVPISVAVVNADGARTPASLTAASPLTVTVAAGGYLELDGREAHPNWLNYSEDAAALTATLGPLVFPTAPAALATFVGGSPAHQERALAQTRSLPLQPASFQAFFESLDSRNAQRTALVDACATLRSSGTAGWAEVLRGLLPVPVISTFSTRLGTCPAPLTGELFSIELASLTITVTAATAPRLLYLLSFDYGDASLSLMREIASRAPSLQLREAAIARIAAQAEPTGGYSPIASEQLGTWRETLRGFLGAATSGTRVRIVWRGSRGLMDDAALAILGRKLRDIPFSPGASRQLLCEAYAVAQTKRPAAWDELVAATAGSTVLSQEARDVLDAPAVCLQRRGPSRAGGTSRGRGQTRHQRAETRAAGGS